MRRRLSIILSMVLVVCAVLGYSAPSFAMEDQEEYVYTIENLLLNPGDTTWQEDFDYTIDGDCIVLNNYKGGTEKNIEIKSTAIVNGVTYNVKLNANCHAFFANEHKHYDGYTWYSGSYNIETITFNNVDTSNVTDMSYMFSHCSNLKKIEFVGFDTRNVTNMSNMFGLCSKLQNVNLNVFNTSKVTNMSEMFRNCETIEELDLSSFDTSNVNDMSLMFIQCYELQKLDLSSFDTSKVVRMYAMFDACKNLKEINLSSFDTSKVKSMELMFYQCHNLESIDVSGFDTSKVTDMNEMFGFCSSLKHLDLSNFNTSSVTEMGWMFDGCTNLQSLDLSRFNTSNTTSMRAMFRHCSNLTKVDLRGFNTSKVTTMASMFAGCSSLKSVDLSSFDVSNVVNFNYERRSGEFTLDESFFNECNNLQEIKIPINLQEDAPLLPDTFIRRDASTIEYTSLPINQTTSFTIVKKGHENDILYDGYTFKKDVYGAVRCFDIDGNPVINQFKCDGVYTYFFQADGTAMTDRLSYHPDGQHVIYFDSQGHEVFSNFANVKKTISGDAVNDFCFFDTFGYLYVDVLTYDQAGQNIYYANPYGVMEVNKW